VDHPALVEGRRLAAELDVVGFVVEPAVDRGLGGVAVRAAVPEELDDLDLAVGALVTC